jgi:hypothetical protein
LIHPQPTGTRRHPSNLHIGNFDFAFCIGTNGHVYEQFYQKDLTAASSAGQIDTAAANGLRTGDTRDG